MKEFEYIIVGAGITGLTAGRILQLQNNNNFIVLESNDNIGGMCATKKIGEHYFDIGGGHVLHSPHKHIMDFVFSHIPKEDFNHYNSKIKIKLKDHIIDFPIELNIWQLPPNEQVEYLMSIIEASKSEPEIISNFENWIRCRLGSKIADEYMIPYNKKLWCIDISKISNDWLYKIPKTNLKKILKTIVEKDAKFDRTVVSHSSFYYPKYDGFQAIPNAIHEKIKDHVLLNTSVDKIKYENGSWIVNDTYKAKNIINTVPWMTLNIESINDDFEKMIELSNSLEYIGNVASLIEKDYDHDSHWMYIPDDSTKHHREFYIHNFVPYSKKNGVMTDINIKRWVETRDDCLYKHINTISYPIPTVNYKDIIKQILDFYAKYNLYGLGRWGKWEYYNIDTCIKDVMEFFNYEQR